jgi:glycosyltransferase EpsE
MVKVSVIIAAYNCQQTIVDCLQSIYRQSFQDWEIVVCNDGSRDATAAILEQYQSKDRRIRLLHNEVNHGAAFTRNRCMAQASGEYIAIQDGDDRSPGHRLTEQVLFLDGHREYAFVSSAIDLYDTHRSLGRIANRENPSKRDFLWSSPFCHAATMFRSEVLRKVGGYRVSFETKRGHDYDLFMRLYADGFRGYNLSQSLYEYRIDGNDCQRRRYKYRIHEAIIRYKGFTSLHLMPRGWLYVFKPLILGLIPFHTLKYLRGCFPHPKDLPDGDRR